MKHHFVRIMAGALAALFFLGGRLDFAPNYLFALTTLTLLAYLGFEIYAFFMSEAGNRWLVNPAVLTSIAVFGVGHGVANLYCYTPTCEDMMDYLGFDYQWLNCTEALALMGLLSMWLGYRSQLGVRLAQWLRDLFRFDVVLQQSWELNWPIVWLCILASIVSRLTQIYLGLYGYNMEFEQLVKHASYNQYLSLSANMGKLALLVLTLHCTGSKRATALDWQILYCVLLCELIFGLLSGIKGQVLIPVLVVVICYYTVRGKVPLGWLAAVPAAVFLAYLVIEPLRETRYSDPTYDNRDPLSIAIAATEAYESSLESEDDRIESSGGFAFLRRMNMVEISAVAIRYKETAASSEETSMVLTDFLVGPLYSFIPRLLWPGKPLRQIGNWFANNVIGQNTTINSVAMGPMGQLYFGGGIPAVCLGFFAVGIAQRLTYQAFWAPCSGGSLMVYLGTVCTISHFEGSIEPVFTTIAQLVPILVVCQYFLFKRS